MNVQPIQMSEFDARHAYIEYRRALAENKDRKWAEAAEYETIAEGYRAIARGKRVLQLADAFRTAGIDPKEQPRLAIANATWRRVDLHTVWLNDRRLWEFHEHGRWPRKNATLRHAVHLPIGSIARRWDQGSLSALVPIIPAPLRPARAIEQYHILFEPVWEPAPPVDPMLLRHLSGDLWVIVAHWNLTAVERAVLGGRL